MILSKLVHGSFFAVGATLLGAFAVVGCAVDPSEEVSDTEDAISAQGAVTQPTFQYVQVDQLTHRRVSLSATGTVSLSIPAQGGTANPVLFRGQKVADFGKLTQLSTARDLEGGTLSKLAGLLNRSTQWKADAARANRDIKSIVVALDKASSNGCLASDWHLATFQDDMADFVCGTLPGGAGGSTATLGSAAASTSPAPADSNTCAIKAFARASRSGDTVTLTFSRNGQDETVGGQWYAGDGVPWEGGDASDRYRCPDSKCTISSVRLTSSYPSVTYTATRIQGRKVQFITTGGSCVYGPY